ncbi:2-amino-4-hydroxy-6-hydroxymethyldihydropteridine diphosphokinase [Lactobacillus sp. LC28-10]|uniref:2-amino-4-hydroxy-6-hydroxymethyldihydropteridine diphosphokinase n=1 Tax=Secundilactobacillus angelensis TaxID=2722706 RepID=A0ABX1L2I4_9LACO|nr:2-amino-4-hydroxy-6-hydroxymethyldihydropteridine diphosphokinase [Secundilactobacillus angelensis]MCH5463365.1 2-amino-4-hydroxy-6-hydroxymethyldihydropteridine diphosphokinase [Secundilactobacillus angelensis]NLR19398.1 2-amino-4-hydroxy-6-hydroxymethyldihydropteridine diphosphokinase [Secundilactobacillus angelensis]
MDERVYLSIGSNIGDRLANLTQAVNLLKADSAVQINAVSSVYETQPWGNLDQANFYNIAVSITTTLEPAALLSVLHEIEQAGHRQRLQHWGPRTIDLDIVYWGKRQINTPELVVPHPRAQERNFVLLPVQEIAGDDPEVKAQVDAALRQKRDTSWIKKVEGISINDDK